MLCSFHANDVGRMWASILRKMNNSFLFDKPQMIYFWHFSRIFFYGTFSLNAVTISFALIYATLIRKLFTLQYTACCAHSASRIWIFPFCFARLLKSIKAKTCYTVMMYFKMKSLFIKAMWMNKSKTPLTLAYWKMLCCIWKWQKCYYWEKTLLRGIFNFVQRTITMTNDS